MIDLRDLFVCAIWNEMAAARAATGSQAFFARKRAERQPAIPRIDLPTANHD